MLLTACNDEVFVPRPSEVPDIENPEPEPEPEKKDSLRIIDFVYDSASLKVYDKPEEDIGKSTIINKTDNRGAYILYDNYNKSLVRISSNTYFVLPWVEEPKYMLEIPGLKDGIPGFYGSELPFAFGTFTLPHEYGPNESHLSYFDLPPYSQVSATIRTKKKRVEATGTLYYEMVDYPGTSRDSVKVNVFVEVAVQTSVEWGEIIPVE